MNHGFFKTVYIAVLLFLLFFFPATLVYGQQSEPWICAERVFNEGNYKQALPLLIALRDEYRAGSRHTNYSRVQIRLAEIMRAYGGIHHSVLQLRENENFILGIPSQDGIILAENCIAKARSYLVLNNFDAMSHECRRAISLLESAKQRTDLLATAYMLLGRYYRDVPNQSDSALHWIKKSMWVAKSSRESQTLMPWIYHAFGYYYHPSSIAYFGDSSDSLKHHFLLSQQYYDSALRSARGVTGNPMLLAQIYHSLGNSLNNEAGIRDRDKLMSVALRYYQLSIAQIKHYNSPIELAAKEWVIGRAFERLHQRDSAIEHFDKGATLIFPDFDAPSSVVPSMRPTLDDQWFISHMSNKASNYYFKYQEQGDVDDLITAYHQFFYTLKFHRYLLAKAANENETIFWNHLYGSNVYHRLLCAALDLKKETGDTTFLMNAYTLVSGSKYASLNVGRLGDFLMDSIRIYSLSAEQRVLFKNLSASGADPLALLSDSEDFALHPVTPPKIDVTATTPTVAKIQTILKGAKTAFIDLYMIGDNLIAFTITEHGQKVFKQDVGPGLRAAVRRLSRQMISMTPQEYALLANGIYKRTLKPVLDSISPSIERLVISPDHYLQFIPWDALVTDTIASTFASLSYLNKKFVISTALTPSHLTTEVVSAEFTGLASDYQASKRFTSIPFSKDLVETIARRTHGDLIEHIAEDNVGRGVFHVASHVAMDTLRPYQSAMFFSDNDSVTIRELQRLPLQPSLVILNGCQTATGPYYVSEGTMSASRAFLRLGTKAVIASVWNVDDKSTADVLTTFYNGFLRGQAAEQSLHEAKLIYLKGVPSDVLANPYYWAGIQISGHRVVLSEANSSFTIWLLVGGSICALFLMLLALRRRSRLLPQST